MRGIEEEGNLDDRVVHERASDEKHKADELDVRVMAPP